MALVFPSVDALCAALRAGLVPKAVQATPVRFCRGSAGELEVEPSSPLGAGRTRDLQTVGVTERKASGELHEASCWAAAVAPVWLGEPDTVPATTLFVLDHSQQVLGLCAELLRMGCDRQEVRVLADGRALVRVRQVPYFVLARAQEPQERVKAFAPAAVEGIWLQVGFHHPLLDAFEGPVPGGSLLVHGDGRFEALSDGAFVAVDQLIFPAGLPTPLEHLPEPRPPRLPVTMRLIDSSRVDEASLWVLRDGTQTVEQWVRGAPEAALDGVLFAVAGTCVLLRVRPGRERAVSALPGAGFARLAELPNLFAPQGLALEPPLSRERLREWLAPDPERVCWLEPGQNALVRHQIAESAFRPLRDWVEYLIDTSAAPLLAWVQSTTFDFERWEGPVPSAPSEARPRADDAGVDNAADETPRPRRSPARRSVSKPDVPKGPAVASLTLPPSETVPRATAEVEERLASEEAAFLSLDAPADSAERLESWVRLAGLYSALQRPRESGLCWAHAMWEVRESDALPVARRWAEAVGSSLPALLEVGTPSETQSRAVVAQLTLHSLQRDASARARLSQAQAWLDRHDEDLDVRSLWLGRAALSRLSGGDRLGLARARDRVLARLRRGLSLERDVPRFVRSVGPGSGRDAARVNRVVQQLEALLKAFEETPRKRSPVEAPPALTRAYVRLTFAWAFARLGHTARARELEGAGVAALDLSAAVNNSLVRLYRARIQQAAEGQSHDTPLGQELTAMVGALGGADRYNVDRLRQRSFVLEPHRRLTPYGNFVRGSGAAQGEDLSALNELADVTQLARGIQERIDAAESPQLDPHERARLASGLLDNLLLLPESVALPLLNRLIAAAQPLPARPKAAVLEDAVKIAGHFGSSDLVKQLVAAVGSLMSELAALPSSSTEQALDMDTAGAAQLLVAGVRTLRRVGLREEANALLSRALQAFKQDNRDHLMARVAIAGGFAFLGQHERAAVAIDDALGHLANETSSMFQRLTYGAVATDVTRLARVIAQSLAMGSAEFALPRLQRLVAPLPWLTDMSPLNDYLCLCIVELADIVAVGHVGEDLTLSEVTRTFLEEDEYRVRRRIHREVLG